MNAAFSHAQEVCVYLENDPDALRECLVALKQNQDGEQALSRGDASKALTDFLSAQRAFADIDAATFLLGITHANVAAAYANLENWESARDYALRSIRITSQEPTFAETEANAHMTLGNALGMLGDRDTARGHYDKAESFYRTRGATDGQLAALEKNRRIVLREQFKSKAVWWKFWD